MVQNCLGSGLAAIASASAVRTLWKFLAWFCRLVIGFWPDPNVREIMCSGARFE